MANPRRFPSVPLTPHIRTKAAPAVRPDSHRAAPTARARARARAASRHRAGPAPEPPRAGRAVAAAGPRRSDVGRRGGARGRFRERPRGWPGAGGAGKRRPAPPELGAPPASRAPAAPRAGAARPRHGGRRCGSAPRCPLGDREPPASRKRHLRSVGALPGPSPQSSARSTRPVRGQQKAEERGAAAAGPTFSAERAGLVRGSPVEARCPQQRPRALSERGRRPQRRRGRGPALLGTAGRGRGARSDARASQPPPRAGARANGRGRGGSARAQVLRLRPWPRPPRPRPLAVTAAP